MKKEQGRRSGEGAATQETEVAERKLGQQKKQPLQPKLQKLHRPEEEQERKEKEKAEKKEKKEKEKKEKESVAQQDGNATGDEDSRSFGVGMFVMLSRCKPQTNGIESICREIMAMRHLHHTTSMATHKGI